MAAGRQLTPDGRRTRRRGIAAAAAILAIAALAILIVQSGGTGSAPETAPPPAAAQPVGGGSYGARPSTGAMDAAQAAQPSGSGIAVLPGPAPISPELRARVQEQATAEVARVRDVVLQTCRPVLHRLQSTVDYDVQVSFDAAGREVARSATATSATPVELDTCILVASAGSLRVDPPGVPMSAHVRITLP